jgi:hypothetical protein
MQTSSISRTHRVAGFLTGIFGVATIFAGGSVAFRLGGADDLAGNVVPFVVWFNFIAGFAYIAAALGIWGNRNWARYLAAMIAAATVLVAIGFTFSVAAGHAFEMRTVGALGFRFLVWAGIASWLFRTA